VIATQNRVKFTREWAMPNKWTFQIKPIAKLIARYVGDGSGWIDPFAGMTSPAEITNDLNPDRPAKFHLHAEEFSKQLTGKFNGVLFDPPYSIRQTKECYEDIGYTMTQKDTQVFPNNIKDLISDKIKIGGYAICFGWNSGGFGHNLGFEMIEILLVPHGGHHYDTIVTVERKFNESMF
jgi:hypothetical protein